MDDVTYGDSGDWSTRIRGPLDSNHRGVEWDNGSGGTAGKSLELINPGDGSLGFRLSNDWGENWGGSIPVGGTPGAQNSIYSTNVAPVILNFSALPVIPRDTDPVTVTAQVVDEAAANAGVSVQLYYRNDGTTTWTVATMLDDGLHGDGLAGDGVYGYVIPAKPNGTIVEMYVQATDATGHARTWPGPVQGDQSVANSNGGQTANILYQVDDSYDPNAAWTPGAPPVYRIIMTAANYTELYNIVHSSDDVSDAAMNGTFISLNGAGMDVRYQVSIRNRGHGTRAGSGNDQNYNIHFTSGHTWMGLSATDINFNISYSQVIGSLLFQLTGLEAPDQTGVVVRVNGTNYADTGSLMYGLYTGKEGYDGNFTANHFPDDPSGNLYVGHYTSSDSANLRYEGTDPNIYRQVYIKQTNTSADDFSDLIHMLDVLNNTPNGPGYFATVSSVIDVNQWMRYIAADRLCAERRGRAVRRRRRRLRPVSRPERHAIPTRSLGLGHAPELPGRLRGSCHGPL